MAASDGDAVYLDFPPSSEAIASLQLEERAGESRHLPRYFLTCGGRRVLFRTRRWRELPSGVDTRPWVDASAGKAAAAPVAAEAGGQKSSAKLFLPLAPEEQAQLLELDQRLRLLYAACRGLPAERLSAWVSPVRKGGERGAQAGVSLKAILHGKSFVGSKPTQLRLLTPAREVVSGLGWAFLEPHLQVSDDFKQGSCLVAFEVSFWEMEQKLGASLGAVALWLRPSRHLIHDECACLARVFEL